MFFKACKPLPVTLKCMIPRSRGRQFCAQPGRKRQPSENACSVDPDCLNRLTNGCQELKLDFWVYKGEEDGEEGSEAEFE